MHNYLLDDKPTVIEQCTRDLSQYEQIRVNDTIMFIFTPNKTLVATPFHLFLIKYSHRNYSPSLNRLRDVVMQGSIRNMSDLLDYNKLTPGANSQFYGLELVRMETSWVNS